MTFQNNHFPKSDTEGMKVTMEYFRNVSSFTSSLENVLLEIIDALCKQDNSKPVLSGMRLQAESEHLGYLQEKYHKMNFTIPGQDSGGISDVVGQIVSESKKTTQLVLADVIDVDNDNPDKLIVPKSLQNNIGKMAALYSKNSSLAIPKIVHKVILPDTQGLLIPRESDYNFARYPFTAGEVLSKLLDSLFDNFILAEFSKLHDFVVEEIQAGNISSSGVRSTKLYDIMTFLEHTGVIRNKEYKIPKSIAKPIEKTELNSEANFQDIVFDEWCSNLHRILKYMRHIQSLLNENHIHISPDLKKKFGP